MDAQAVLSRARSDEVPASWTVWPLQRNRVLRAALGWLVIGVVGAILLVIVAAQTIPSNFSRGSGSIILTSVLLIALGLMAFGGLGIVVYDLWRVRHAEEFLIVMTPDDYVKAQPGKVTHVPMEHVSYVTLRGVRIPEERAPTTSEIINSMQKGGRLNRFMGDINYRRQPKQAPSLAFLDTRDNSEVVVATDNSFDELLAMEQILSMHARQKDRSYFS
jgi:hypothetical protein